MSAIASKHSRKRAHIRRSLSERIGYGIILILLTLLTLICLYPFYQVLVCSVSDPNIVMRKNSLLLWPEGFQLDAYRLVLQNRNLRSGFVNTFKYLALGTCLQYLITTLAAYPLSLKDAKLKRPLMIYMTITMYFSGGLIPNYLLVRNLGMYDTLWALIIPGAISTYNMIIMRTMFQSIPAGQREAATVMGYSRSQTFFRILFPQMVKRVMPPVTNEVITLVKDTSLAFALAYTEMFTMAKQIAASQASLMPLFVAGVFYYIFNFVVATVMEQIEKKLDYYR